MAGPAVGRAALQVGESLRGSDARIDPIALAAVAHSTAATRRPAQAEMAQVLHTWADAGAVGLIEAPTGTGKSYAILAAALDWLAGGNDRTAIVATFTKQLQAQLAHDVAVLDSAVPGLLQASDVVKGAANRLSLRALLVTLADATALDGRRGRPGGRNRFCEQLPFRELLAYLLLRLLRADVITQQWEAHSVDPVDMPAFFGDYCGPVLPVWLDSLSQAANGEFDAKITQPIAAHTDLVAEALAGHRLILANHALLLAHLDDLGALPGDTLLVVDEAHMLEDAATSALATSLDYRAMEDLAEELAAWVSEQRASGERAAVADRVRDLSLLLDAEQLPKVASRAFDERSAGAGASVGGRSVTLASAYTGTPGITQVRTLSGLLTRLSGQCSAIVATLSAYQDAHARRWTSSLPSGCGA